MSRPASIFCLLFLFLTALDCHDLYLLPDGFVVNPQTGIRVAFHNGDAFPESEVAPKPERLKDALVRSFRQSRPISGLRIDGKETIGIAQTPGPGCLFLSVRTVPNLIELPAGKFSAYLNEEGLTQVLQWRERHGETAKPGKERYRKFAKSLVVAATPDDFYKQPLGLLIEIVPLSNPYTLPAGSKLPVRVLFRGKPAPDLQLEAAWAGDTGKKGEVIGRTGADGQIEVPLSKQGKWRLHTLAMERCSDSAVADWESYWASLTFAVR